MPASFCAASGQLPYMPSCSPTCCDCDVSAATKVNPLARWACEVPKLLDVKVNSTADRAGSRESCRVQVCMHGHVLVATGCASTNMTAALHMLHAMQVSSCHKRPDVLCNGQPWPTRCHQSHAWTSTAGCLLQSMYIISCRSCDHHAHPVSIHSPAEPQQLRTPAG